ncbi:DUF2530 domain-containing protein [Allokutzneria albata]|uniref:DUF2530 domain-containing protein n=1 Tax=Allokutzneria albata TaxID=211114 RepID=A0A1H0AY12_ALLAB|nr:DUF2530 domain-containing protein [Allokutzneria albata]SDN38332.1 Protein of unknown function [Allokutzneria albata]
MAEKSERGQVTSAESPAPPPLPRALADPVPLIATGTALWFVAFAVLLVLRTAFDTGDWVWVWTTLSGGLLGLIGWSIIMWQRRAARRGSRTAQHGDGL